jgi:GntR family transcriptional regulator/MocR family aminotransferase
LGSWDLAIALDRSKPEPLYLQLVKAIEVGIRHGRFKPGDALPGTRALAELLGVNRNTSLAAYKELEAEGWIEVNPDRGTFVAQTLPFVLDGPAGISAQDSASWKRATPRSEPFFQPGAPAVESFQLIPDTTDLRLAPTDAIHRAYGRVLKLHPERLLQPGWDPRGLLDLRHSVSKMLRDMRGLAVEAGNLLLTRGLMSTLNLVARVLFAPGDAVAVENPGWFRVAEAFRSAGARLFAVPVDAHGLNVEALEALLILEPIRLLYLSASPQHPTQVTLDPARRKRLLELSRVHGFRILEGDPGLGFHREKNPSLPLASEDLHGRVLYFSSFEQILAPGLQVGFLAGEAGLIKALAQQRQLVDWPGNLVQEATIEETLRDGEVVRHLRRIRKLTDERRDTMVDRLLLHLHPAISVRNPKEGLSLWIRVAEEVPMEAWTERCLAHGVVFYPGGLYDLQRQNLPFISLGFAAHNLDEQNEACARMALALKEVRVPRALSRP